MICADNRVLWDEIEKSSSNSFSYISDAKSASIWPEKNAKDVMSICSERIEVFLIGSRSQRKHKFQDLRWGFFLFFCVLFCFLNQQSLLKVRNSKYKDLYLFNRVCASL